ncbi:hypothetical protein ASPTUDRAFT_45545 [Aspergillus tubingensis CBS 134.48]|uniref:Uncharacterized protein n=1 Tax=Aspergillus tubingensis (strain CBS 134.48) TaxID=767770 RepID=A0A1L9MZ76_ASPTC|nr:hypothetical protein ASPTUDRAFT_45545 [Aspergillus tubingensis CBS 134.48]
MKLGSAPLTQLAIFSTPSPYSHCLCSVPLILSSFLVEQLSALTCHMKHLNPGGATQLCFSLIICKGPFSNFISGLLRHVQSGTRTIDTTK